VGSDGDIEAHPRTFLFADMRGWTRYTQEHGDEAASALAARFATLARTTVPEFSGELLELTGDGMLSVFGSARQALRASVELQRRLRAATGEESVFPLGVGMGLDAGEAVPTEGGYRGGALNLAARLCAMARPGQILASESAVHLARRIEGLRFERRRAVRLKGISEPVRLVEVVPEEPLPPLLEPKALGRRRGNLAIAAIALLVIGLAAGTALLAGVGHAGHESQAAVPLHANSVAVLDIKSGRVVHDVQVGDGPEEIVSGGGLVWVANLGDKTVSLLDPTTYTHREVGIGITPDSLAYGSDLAWAADGSQGTGVSIASDESFESFTVPGCRTGCSVSVALTHDAIWLGVTTLAPGFGPARGVVDILNPARLKPTDRVKGVATDQQVVGGGSLWGYGLNGFWLTQVDLRTHTRISKTRLPPGVGEGVYTNPGVAYGFGYAWAVSPLGSLFRVTPDGQHVHTIPIPRGGSGVAAGAGSIWVADENGALLRIDPYKATITRRYRLGHDPRYVTVAYNRVWVTLGGA
jgi:class 3 adenylate cyclase/streptogramin lyase